MSRRLLRRISQCATFLSTFLLLLCLPLWSQSPDSSLVRLRIELLLPSAPITGVPLSTTVMVQALQNKTAAQKVVVREGAPAELTLVPGRYQITSATALEVGSESYGWDMEVPVTEQTNEVRLSEENALRVSDIDSDGEQPAVAASKVGNSDTTGPSAAAADRAVQPPPDIRPVKDRDTEEQIEALLRVWTTSLRDHDLTSQMSCYASSLSEYFHQRNVSWEFVKRDKERFLQRYPEVRQLSLSDIHIFGGAGSPEATALKTWNFGGLKQWTGRVVTHLKFRNEAGRWVIVSERERLAQRDGAR